MTSTIGIIGLGAMGAGMARNLVRAGFAVRGYDVDPARVAAVEPDGVQPVASPAEAARDAELLAVVVFSHGQAESVLLGADGALETLPRDAVVTMHTTMAPDQSISLETRLRQSGHRFVDAPVTGGKIGADEATMTVIASGEETAMAAARPVFEAVAAKVARCGDRAGPASTVKMVNQLMVGVQVAATCEAIALAARAGADPAVVHEVIGSGSARSRVWESRVEAILARDYEPRGVVDIFLKDLDIVLQAGKSMSFPLPVTAAAMQQFLSAAAQGHGRANDNAVVKVYEALAGIDVAGAAESARRERDHQN